jgi:uncharacterized protein YbjT (DUF2867 family)
VRAPILVTGATGFIGGLLADALVAHGLPVRCLARRPGALRGRPGVEVVGGDVLDPSSLAAPLRGVEVAYYLVHSMGSADFEEQDRRAARNFGAAARAAGVRRIVYLGGLGRGSDLSSHLASRQEVGRILRESGVPTVELRASVILGPGSLSFALVRALVERLPVMVTPRWVRTPTQPIAVEDVVAYLLAALDPPVEGSVVYEIGGSDQVTYADLMKEYARQRGLRRWMIPVPVLSPRLSSLWLALVTPVYARVGRKLVDGLRNETLVHDDRARRDFPVRPCGMAEAIARALAREDRAYAATLWADATSPSAGGGAPFGARLVDSRAIEVPCPVADAFEAVRRIGGATGWYYGDWACRLRGLVDRLLGGPGMRRGRPHPERLAPGDAVDGWRVEGVEPPRLVRLAAEMRLPGRAWLQFEIAPAGTGSRICQTAIFDPRGLAGRAYWYALLPIHGILFRGMLRNLGRAAVRRGRGASAPPGGDSDASAGAPPPPGGAGSAAGRGG